MSQLFLGQDIIPQSFGAFAPRSEGIARTTRGIRSSPPNPYDLPSWEVGQLDLGLCESKTLLRVSYDID